MAGPLKGKIRGKLVVATKHLEDRLESRSLRVEDVLEVIENYDVVYPSKDGKTQKLFKRFSSKKALMVAIKEDEKRIIVNSAWEK